ncbi:hypothetical protein FDECE_5238 [Fusarium decemcellulare]|nr:hypothetical protein FDECE_5238 [Fusarium decemcellulare]
MDRASFPPFWEFNPDMASTRRPRSPRSPSPELEEDELDSPPMRPMEQHRRILFPDFEYMSGIQGPERGPRKALGGYSTPYMLETSDFLTAGSGGTAHGTSPDVLRKEKPKNRSDSASSSTGPTSSEASTSNASTTTEVNILAAVLPPERASTVYKQVLAVFEKLIDERFVLLRSHGPCSMSGSSRGNPSENQSSSASKETNTSNQCGGQLRGDDEGEGSEAPDDGDGDHRPVKKRLTEKGAQPKQKIACPFRKRFPEQYSTEKTCMGPGFSGIHRMKEHLRRRHFKERVCWRCQEQFDTNQLLQQHMQADRPCKRKRIEALTGLITQFQMDDISKIRSSPITSITQTWREIYLILFPEVDEAAIPAPYLDFEPLSTSDSLDHLINHVEYEAYLKQHLPQRILSKLNEEFQIMAEHAKRRLVEIVNEESLETLKCYMQQKRANPSSGLGQSSDQTSDRPSDDIEFDFDLLGGAFVDSALDNSIIPDYSDWQLEDLKEGTDLASRLTFLAPLLGSACVAAKGAEYPLSYGTAWAGPVRYADKFNISSNSTGFTKAEATLIMPHLSIPKKPHEKVEQYTASYWIGLDGVLSSELIRGLWQAGVIMSVWTNGTTEYRGFHEWIPDDPLDVSPAKLAISEGDHIHVLLETTNNGYHGSTTLTNLNTSQTYTHNQDAPTAWRGPTFPAQGATAEWIIEAGTYLNGPQYVFPDWGTAQFLGARACYKNGECALAGDGTADQGRMTAVMWNDTRTLYTQSCAKGDHVSIEYIEEVLS